jgi:hypothetical protein
MPTKFAPQAFTFTVPDGWSADSDGFVEKNVEPGSSPLEHGADAALFAAFRVTHVYRDACNWHGTVTEAGTTPEELVNLLARQRGRETATPRDVSVSGYPAQLVELVLPADFDTAECDEGFARVWPDVGGSENGGWPARAGQTDRIYVVDVKGDRVVLLATTYAAPPAADARKQRRRRRSSTRFASTRRPSAARCLVIRPRAPTPAVRQGSASRRCRAEPGRWDRAGARSQMR